MTKQRRPFTFGTVSNQTIPNCSHDPHSITKLKMMSVKNTEWQAQYMSRSQFLCIHLSWIQRKERIHRCQHPQLYQYPVQHFHSKERFNKCDVCCTSSAVLGLGSGGETDMWSRDHQRGASCVSLQQPQWRRADEAAHDYQTRRWLDILHSLRRVRWCAVSFSPSRSDNKAEVHGVRRSRVSLGCRLLPPGPEKHLSVPRPWKGRPWEEDNKEPHVDAGMGGTPERGLPGRGQRQAVSRQSLFNCSIMFIDPFSFSPFVMLLFSFLSVLSLFHI